MSYKTPYENIYEDTTSGHTARNGIIIDTFDGETIYSIPINWVQRRVGTWGAKGIWGFRSSFGKQHHTTITLIPEIA
jgi:hypothetical protein